MKKIKFFLFAILIVTILTGCKEEKLNESFYIIEDQVQKPLQKEEGTEILTADKTVLKLYYPDTTKQFILSKMIEVEEINKSTIIEHILELEYLEESTRLIQLNGEELEDVGKLVTAEFSIQLEEGLKKLDPKEGQIVYACIVNTLLDAYNAAGVTIRVENEVLAFPQAEIELGKDSVLLPDGYFPHFALAHEATIIRQMIFAENEINIEYTRFFSEEGYSIYYESDNYVSGYNKEEGLAVFEKVDATTSFCIYLSDSSKIDTIENLSNQEVLGVVEPAENLEMEIGAEGYAATGIFKSGDEQVSNFYVIEKEGQIYVIEIKMELESSIEDGKRIGNMLDSFQIIN